MTRHDGGLDRQLTGAAVARVSAVVEVACGPCADGRQGQIVDALVRASRQACATAIDVGVDVQVAHTVTCASELPVMVGYRCSICGAWAREIDRLHPDDRRPRAIGCDNHGTPFGEPMPRMDAVVLSPGRTVMTGEQIQALC